MDRDGLANFFLGLGIGVGLGILFAPKSGDETRDILLGKADEGKEYLKRQSAAWKDQAGDIIDKGKDALNRQKDNLSDAVEAGQAGLSGESGAESFGGIAFVNKTGGWG